MNIRPYAILVLCALAIAADDPNALFDKAQKAHASLDDKKAIALLTKADSAWQNTTPNAPEHAEALEFLALLMRSQAAQAAEASGPKPYATDVESWKTDAAPFVKRALEICQANGSTKPEDLALALELQADVLGRSENGEPFWDRASKIRAQRVAELYGTPRTDSPSADGLPVDRIRPGITGPSILAKHEPNYSEDARLMRYSGTVLLSVIIDAQGVPSRIRLVRGLGYGLDENAAQTIGTWRFRPATKNGVPVAVQVAIEVNFRLL